MLAALVACLVAAPAASAQEKCRAGSPTAQMYCDPATLTAVASGSDDSGDPSAGDPTASDPAAGLPFTGYDIGLALAVGLGMVGAGALVRRAASRQDPQP